MPNINVSINQLPIAQSGDPITQDGYVLVEQHGELRRAQLSQLMGTQHQQMAQDMERMRLQQAYAGTHTHTLGGLFGAGGTYAAANNVYTQTVYTQTVADNTGTWGTAHSGLGGGNAGTVNVWGGGGGAGENDPGAYNWVQVTQELRPSASSTHDAHLTSKAEKRARDLLLSHLDATQRYTFETGNQFNVIGKSGRTYRIVYGHYPARNVTWVHGGMDIAAYCTHPIPIHGRHLPMGDVLLAQKLALETDDKAFCRTACHSLLRQPPKGEWVKPGDEDGTVQRRREEYNQRMAEIIESRERERRQRYADLMNAHTSASQHGTVDNRTFWGRMFGA